MNRRAKNFIGSFSYTLLSNLISLLVSSLVVLVIPKLIGIQEYGYWQVYIFYSSYIGFMHFGWADGLYLRYGGFEYKDLDKKMFKSQFVMYFLSQLIIAIIILFFTSFYTLGSDKTYILIMISLAMVIYNVRIVLLFILQATNRIKEYARITILDRGLYFLIIVMFLMIGVREYEYMIISDILSKIISLILAMYYCKEIIFQKLDNLQFSINEAYESIRVGIKVMIASIASSLIVGIVRLGIEYTWNIETFGKISLTLSLSNMMMPFINSIALILFPILRKTNQDRLASVYSTMRDVLMVLLLGLLILYYPIKFILSAWLPSYTESLMYMALVFPICVYEGKMSLLVNTYLKTLREESVILKVNVIALIASLISTYITTILAKQLNLAVISIIFLLAFRCIIAEIYLSRILRISLYKDIMLEVGMTIVFILTGWIVNSWMTVILYLLAYIVYIFIKRNDIISTLKNLKTLVKAA